MRPPADLAEGVEVQVAAKKKGLGRGLDALLPEADELLPNVVQEIPVGDIDPNTEQPRRSFPEEAMTQLSASGTEQGILQPLLVVEQPGGRYRIVAGERRWRAARQAGLATVPCIVRDMDMIRQMEVSLIENLQREDLNPMEEAGGYRVLMEEYGLTQEEVAQQVGKSRPAVANALRLLSLPPSLHPLLEDGQLSAGHARAILSVPSPQLQEKLADKVVAEGLSVRQTEALAKRLAAGEATPPPRPEGPDLSIYLKEAERTLGARFGRKVSIVSGKRKGRIELEYYGPDDLTALLDLLEKAPSAGRGELL